MTLPGSGIQKYVVSTSSSLERKLVTDASEIGPAEISRGSTTTLSI